MAPNFSFSREQLVSLVEQLSFPNPEGDPINPRGPGGPVIHDREHLWNFGPSPDPWRAGPWPQPWRAAAFVSATLDRQLDALQLAQVIASDGSERGIIIVGGRIQQIAEELCPTPPKFPWPWPRPHGLEAVELFAAGLAFQQAANNSLGAAVSKNLNAGADLLFQTGINRLEQQSQRALGATA